MSYHRTSTRPKPCAGVSLLLAVLLCPAEASAQRSNYESVLFGERASGMAGATMALADEPSAVFYNPAGLAQLDYDILGLSVQALGGVASAGEGLVRIGDTTASTSSSTFGALPTSAAYSFPLGSAGTFALSAVVPVIQDVAYSHGLQAPDGTVDLVVESSIQEEEILIGPSYAVRAGPIHFGATAYIEYASVGIESLQAVAATDVGGSTFALNRTRRSSGQQVGITGVFGALVRFNPRWSAGLRLRFPNLPLYSSSEHTFVETVTVGGSSTGQTMIHGAAGTMTYPHPFGVGLGLAYRARRLHVALDVRSYLPTNQYELFGGSPETSWDPTVTVPPGQFVANFALGSEVFLTQKVSMLMGVHTDAAATPSDTELDVAGSTTMSFIGVTVGGRFLSDAGTFTTSIGARHGEGSIDSLTFADGLTRGEPGSVQQTTGMLTLSWTRSLTTDWVSLKRQVDAVVGNKP